MMSRRNVLGVVFVLLLLFTMTSRANAVSVSFTSNFHSGAPLSTISGLFEYTVDGANVLTFTSFDLTIKNKTYDISDLDVIQPWRPMDMTHTLFAGADGIANDIRHQDVDDFWFRWNWDKLEMAELRYTTFEDDGLWKADDYTIKVAAVPEPASVALLGIGIVGIAGAEARRRREKKAIDKS